MFPEVSEEKLFEKTVDDSQMTGPKCDLKKATYKYHSWTVNIFW